MNIKSRDAWSSCAKLFLVVLASLSGLHVKPGIPTSVECSLGASKV